MRIAYNPKSASGPLTTAPTGDYLNAITFDLIGHNIFTRGEMFKGTDTTYEVFRKATQSAVGYNGLVPAPSYSTNAIRFLREDGTWQFLQSNSQRPIDIDNNNVLLNTDIDKSLNLVAGNNIVLEPQTDSDGNFTGEVVIKTTFQVSGDFTGELSDAFTTVKVGAALLQATNNKQLTLNAGTGITISPNTTNNSIQIAAPIFTGATSTADGTIGIVPQPLITNTTSYLRGDGTWYTLDTSQIYSLTSYSYNYNLTDTPTNLKATDTLNQALAKLEHKANQGVAAYNWYISVTAEDTDEYVNKWQEIVDFLNEVKNSDGDILDQFVTIKTAQTITGAKTFTTDITAEGFIKNKSSDEYVLLGGGGHKKIDDFVSKADELPSAEFTKVLTVTQNWMDTGITGIPNTGTYIVQISANTGTMAECIWSGVMSWYNGTCSDDDSDEILLHRSGKSYSNTIYLRTKMSSGSLSLQIAANENIAECSYTFKFKQIL